MGALGEFEGRTVWMSRLAIGAITLPVDRVLHHGDEVIVQLRVRVGPVEHDEVGDSGTWARTHKSKVVRQGERKYPVGVLLPDEMQSAAVQALQDLVDAREGVQRLQGDDSPDWLQEDPTESTTVEMGDGPAPARRQRRHGSGVSAEEAGLPEGGPAEPGA